VTDPNARLVLEPEEPFAEGRQTLALFRRPRPNHDENWIACIRSRETPNCDVLTGYKVMVALDLANRSWREGKMMHFDAERERVSG
jgi:hypothetical protein